MSSVVTTFARRKSRQPGRGDFQDGLDYTCVVEPPAKKPPPERSETDESLRVERAKTDKELAAARTAIEEGADAAVEQARDHAEDLLRKTRERTDQDMAARHASTSLREEVMRERMQEDRVVAGERSSADEQLHKEREERERALASLLHYERETTDEKLTLERARADEALATRDEFLAMVSHDLRSHLGGIAMNAARIAKQASSEESHTAEILRHVDGIQRFTARMNRLIGDLLDLVSLEAGKLAVSPGPHDAAQLVRDAMEAFQLSFAAKGIALQAHLASGTLLAKFDHERILQVIANLLSNALKFTPEGGRVTLSIAPSGAYVRFSVLDSGVGIPTTDLESIFERWSQVQAKDRRGLGLGLYIARCIIEAHGGKIWAERPNGGGGAVHFTLPAVPTQ